MARRVCFIITSPIHYSRSKLLLEALADHPDLQLQIAVAASAILPKYGNVLEVMEQDGFSADAKITMTLAGGSRVAMAKTTGIGVTEFATAFDNLAPDIVLIRGDRYEVLAAAIAAAYMNITVAHIEGGDLTGTIDESVRHAVTKLAHLHFATNDDSRKRIVQMGEDPKHVFNVGSSDLEFASKHAASISSDEINRTGVGDAVDLNAPFLTVMFHPVTTEEQNGRHATILLDAVHGTGMQTIWFWPNVDAGTDDVAKAIRVFRETKDTKNMHFTKYLVAEKFMALLKRTACLIGNSSAGIKECSYLGIPVVNIGSRQDGRLRGTNVLDTGYGEKEIKAAIDAQIQHGAFEQSKLYFKEHCSLNIANKLATIDLYVQKKFYSADDG